MPYVFVLSDKSTTSALLVMHVGDNGKDVRDTRAIRASQAFHVADALAALKALIDAIDAPTNTNAVQLLEPVYEQARAVIARLAGAELSE
jgi:hypothetical protein